MTVAVFIGCVPDFLTLANRNAMEGIELDSDWHHVHMYLHAG